MFYALMPDDILFCIDVVWPEYVFLTRSGEKITKSNTIFECIDDLNNSHDLPIVDACNRLH